MRKIALISDGWRRYVTYSWLQGLMQRAEEMGLDLCVYGFNTNGNLSYDPKYNAGEYNLYNLPNYEDYDGIVFDCTNTTDKNQIDWIVDKLRKTNVPVVSICYYVEGFYYIGNDNYELFAEVLEHLVNVHGEKRLVFAGGPDFNYENRLRCSAFRDIVNKYQLPVTEEDYLFGEFDFGTGERYFREWMEKGRELPDAFVCASDNIATGICHEAEKYGYEVPRDFRVTGFDNLDKAAYFKPQITTVEHNRGNISKNSLQILNDVWEGKEVPPFTFLQSEVICGESCGCPNSGRVNYRDYAKWKIEWTVIEEANDNETVKLENRIAECDNYEGLFEGFAGYIRTLKCQGLFIVVDDRLLEAKPENVFPTEGYDRNHMVVVYAMENNERIHGIRTIEELTTYLDNQGTNDGHITFPIHFRDEIVGFTLLKNPDFLYDNPFFYDVHSTFIAKLQNLYKQMQLATAVSRMQDLYNRDTLTKLYNRVAYNEMITPKFARFQEEKVPCAIIFFDVDGFKQINDTLGHEYGDQVLITIAKTMEKCRPKDGYTYRFGGDEFVEFFPYALPGKIERFTSEVTKCLEKQNIIVSHGVIVTDPSLELDLDDYLVMADQKMYSVKQERKKNATQRDVTPHLIETEEAPKFYRGVDISSLPQKDDDSVLYYDDDGQEIDAFALLKQNHVDSVRLRIWNEPANEPESGGYCDLAHTLEMAKRIHEQGLHFVLDFHYSDYWADPGQQRKPKAWEGLSFDELCDAVYDYTKDVLIALAKIDCLPDMVQVGNEVRSGMLFPDGAVPQYDQLARLLNSGIRAVRSVSADIKVMIHLDQGGRFYYMKDWFDSVFGAGLLPIDAIGISFYSFWHGTYMDLRDCIKQLKERYHLPVYVVETAHPWRQDGTCDHVSAEQMKTAGLPAGKEEQKKALQTILQIVSEASKDSDTGVYYWEPLGITGGAYGSWDDQMGMLDDTHAPLPAWEAYRDFDREHPAIDHLDDYIEELYQADEECQIPAGTNLVMNADFADGMDGWWCTKNLSEVVVEERDHEVYVSSDANFTCKINRELRIDQPGKYLLQVDYRGTNTTGVRVDLYLKTISCNGEERFAKEIFPSDVRFVTQSLEIENVPAGTVQIGVEWNCPPVFARITNFRLVRLDSE